MCSCRARIDRIVAGVPHAARALLAQIPLRSRSISHWRSCWPCRWLPTSARGHHCVTNAVRLARRQLGLNRMYGHSSLHCKHERYKSNHHTHVYPFNRLLLHSICAPYQRRRLLRCIARTATQTFVKRAPPRPTPPSCWLSTRWCSTSASLSLPHCRCVRSTEDDSRICSALTAMYVP